MEESNKELLEYLYEVVEMGQYSTKELEKDLHDKDNQLKDHLVNILKEYEKFYQQAKKLLEKHKLEKKEIGAFTKIGASIGMKKKVLEDNSDASIADMLIKGLTMGNLEMCKKIDQYEKKVDHKILELARDIQKFQETKIDELKKFL